MSEPAPNANIPRREIRGDIQFSIVEREGGGKPTWCTEPEVRAHRAANAIANFGFKRGTRTRAVLVVLGFRSSYLNVPRVLTRSEERRVGKECRCRWSA